MKGSVPFIASTTLTLILLGQPVGSQTVVPVGEQGQVNTYTTGEQRRPAVAVNADGELVVVWQSNGSGGDDSSGYSIQGRRYDSNGLSIGFQGQVNSFTFGDQKGPEVAAVPGGGFVVVWHSFGSDGNDRDGYSIHGQRYESDGDPVGGEFQVNTYTTTNQKYPAVATDAEGDFVVVWRS